MKKDHAPMSAYANHSFGDYRNDNGKRFRLLNMTDINHVLYRIKVIILAILGQTYVR